MEPRRSDEREVLQLLCAIRQRGLLSRLPADLAAEITRSAPLVHYPAGSVSFPASEGTSLGIVAGGLLRYYLSAADGRQLTIRYLSLGDLTGSLVPAGSGLTTGVQALEPSLLLHLDPTRLEALAKQHPELSFAMVQ